MRGTSYNYLKFILKIKICVYTIAKASRRFLVLSNFRFIQATKARKRKKKKKVVIDLRGRKSSSSVFKIFLGEYYLFYLLAHAVCKSSPWAIGTPRAKWAPRSGRRARGGACLPAYLVVLTPTSTNQDPGRKGVDPFN